MAQSKLILDYVYGHEATRPQHLWLTQPTGGGAVADFTWQQTMDQARRIAAYLRAHNFEPGARIAILSKNCAHFFIAELGIWMAGCTTVAIFPTETAETVRFVLEHSGASALFIGKLDTWEHQAAAVPAELPCVSFPLAPESAKKRGEAWDTVLARTAPLTGQPARAPDDIAILMYTSGSTGQPKGVMHRFDRITRCGEGMLASIREAIGPDEEIRILSYLPLAHVFERSWVECTSIVEGRGHVFFAETLETFVADLQRARPTVFISVPRLWLKFQQGVFHKMPEKKLNFLLSLPIIGSIIARKVLRGLGLDSVKHAGSGSAPIPAGLIAWYRKLGLNLVEGYGMTEDFAYSNISSIRLNAPGYVGSPLPGVEVRISDEGEVLLKSPGQMQGYYKQPELTAESFTDDGFFRTGDLGEVRSDGMLKLTGRKKELFKTGKGKYIAPAPIENRINASPLIELSMVSGVGQQAAYATVVLAEEQRPKASDAAGRAELTAQLAALLHEVNTGLADYEQLRMIVVASEPWTIDNGCLTPTMKIKRARIEANVAASVERWYGQPGPVIWA
ncbi:MAG: AMP-binding protein [Burkholderiales bacterium]|nr:AMP-binding protein [Burkholderiales bacterium]